MGKNKKTKKVTKVTDIDPLNKIMVHIYPKRTESEVYLSQSFDITKLLKFIESKRQQNPEIKTTLFHCIVTIMLRLLKERPVMNRYITGGALYQRNFISAAFVSKQKLDVRTKEQLMLLNAKDDMTIDSISKTIVGDIKAVQDKESSNEGFNDIVKFLSRFPRLLLIFMSKILRWLDYWNHAPKSLKDGDPNFSSVLMTNLGSIIDCSSIYHHLNNYGTNSLIVAIGRIYKKEIIAQDSTKQVRDFVDIGFTVDERIAYGYYLTDSLKFFKYMLDNPEILDLPLGKQSNFEAVQ